VQRKKLCALKEMLFAWAFRRGLKKERQHRGWMDDRLQFEPFEARA